jgi:cation:H+ antiporter
VDAALPFLVFFVSAAVVVAGGIQIARTGDRIAGQTGIGGLWIGAVLVAAATSLPEIVVGVSAAAIEEPDLTAGDLFGSSMANMVILAILDLLYRQRRVWLSVSLDHALVAALAIALTSLAAAFIAADVDVAAGHVGGSTLVLAAAYLLGARVVLRQQYLSARRGADVTPSKPAPARWRGASGKTVAGFAFGAVLVLAAGPLLATSAADVADEAGLTKSFVGVALLAVTTSLPELATGVAAVRIKAYDLAVGNLFGSNAFNMSVFLFVDIAYTPGPVFSSLSETQVLAAAFAILLTTLAMMGIIHRAERRFLLIEPDAGLVILAYIAGMWLLFQSGS